MFPEIKANHRSTTLLKKWEPIVSGWKGSGLKQHQYCVREGVRYTQFRYWCLRINKLRNKSNEKTGNSIVKAGRINISNLPTEESDCHMRLCFENYCLELKDNFSSESLNRLMNVLKRK